MPFWLLNIAAILLFNTFAFSQNNVENQYLSNDEYWYSTGIVKKSSGSNYRMEARNIALSGIARQISSTITGIETRITSEELVKDKDYGISQEVYSSTISNEINATIEYDVEDVEKKVYGKSYHHVIRLNKDKYFENRKNKRNNAINRSVSILNNLDAYPSKAAISNLNDIVIALIPYADENLDFNLNSTQSVNLLGHAVSLSRNYVDRISVDYFVSKYPLKNINDELEFVIKVYDNKTDRIINDIDLLNVKNNKILKKNSDGTFTVKSKISRKNSFQYMLNLKSSFPDFIVFNIEDKFFEVEDPYFKKQKNPTITFLFDDSNSYPVPRFGFEIVTKDILDGLKKDFQASVYQTEGGNYIKNNNSIQPIELGKIDKLGDFLITAEIIYDDFDKNQYGRYVCYVNAEFSFTYLAGNKSTNYSVPQDIRGISALSKNDAIRDALETINEKYGEEIYNEFKNTLLN